MANIIVECLTSQLAPRQSVRAIIIIVTHRAQHSTLNMQDLEGLTVVVVTYWPVFSVTTHHPILFDKMENLEQLQNLARQFQMSVTSSAKSEFNHYDNLFNISLCYG